jgi:hypothetical protein
MEETTHSESCSSIRLYLKISYDGSVLGIHMTHGTTFVPVNNAQTELQATKQSGAVVSVEGS